MQVLHDFPGTGQHIRMGRACLKLPLVSLESIQVVCLEDRLKDCGCIGVYVFSPPDDITMSKEGGTWMGAVVPGAPQSKLHVRLPFAWARTCIFPESRTRTRIRTEVLGASCRYFNMPSLVHALMLRACALKQVAVVNVVPPIKWVFRHAARE
eukprot:4624754-Amphidinium_carterae.1